MYRSTQFPINFIGVNNYHCIILYSKSIGYNTEVLKHYITGV